MKNNLFYKRLLLSSTFLAVVLDASIHSVWSSAVIEEENNHNRTISYDMMASFIDITQMPGVHLPVSSPKQCDPLFDQLIKKIDEASLTASSAASVESTVTSEWETNAENVAPTSLILAHQDKSEETVGQTTSLTNPLQDSTINPSTPTMMAPKQAYSSWNPLRFIWGAGSTPSSQPMTVMVTVNEAISLPTAEIAKDLTAGNISHQPESGIDQPKKMIEDQTITASSPLIVVKAEDITSSVHAVPESNGNSIEPGADIAITPDATVVIPTVVLPQQVQSSSGWLSYLNPLSYFGGSSQPVQLIAETLQNGPSNVVSDQESPLPSEEINGGRTEDLDKSFEATASTHRDFFDDLNASLDLIRIEAKINLTNVLEELKQKVKKVPESTSVDVASDHQFESSGLDHNKIRANFKNVLEEIRQGGNETGGLIVSYANPVKASSPIFLHTTGDVFLIPQNLLSGNFQPISNIGSISQEQKKRLKSYQQKSDAKPEISNYNPFAIESPAPQVETTGLSHHNITVDTQQDTTPSSLPQLKPNHYWLYDGQQIIMHPKHTYEFTHDNQNSFRFSADVLTQLIAEGRFLIDKIRITKIITSDGIVIYPQSKS